MSNGRFMSCSKIFDLIEEIAITGEWLQNLGMCSVLSAFEQHRIF
jgi:hypothetical protein